MEEDETNWQGDAFEPYEENIQALAADNNLEVACLRMPIEDVNVPSEVAMKNTLDAIDDSLAQRKPVYVYCWGGRG
jgi:protein-tyrosine phosphatase